MYFRFVISDRRKDEKISERKENGIREYAQGEWIIETSFHQGDLPLVYPIIRTCRGTYRGGWGGGWGGGGKK